MKFNIEPGQDDATQSLRLMSKRASTAHRETSHKVEQNGSRASTRSQRSNQSLASQHMPDYDTSSSEDDDETTGLGLDV